MRKILIALLMIFLSFFAVSAQTRLMNPLRQIKISGTDSWHVNSLADVKLIKRSYGGENDSVTLAEILFNPNIRLIDPDTFKLETSLVAPDSALLKRDSSRIIDVHPQDVIQANVLKIESKNKKASITFYGSIRVNGATDYNGLQSVNWFNTYYIPVGEANTNVRRFFLSANQTRLGIQGMNKTLWGPINYRIEADFSGSAKGNLMKLRHAYGQFINILAGQTWSVFSDPSSIPWTVDAEGPNSAVNARSVQIRYSNLINENFRWMVSIESPQIDYDSDTVNIYQGTPDLAGRMKYMTKWGHIQGALVLRSLGARNPVNQPTSSMGIGGLLSGRYDITPHKNILLFQLVAGKGIARYIKTLNGTGNDLIYNPGTGLYEPLTVFGGLISFAHGWRKNIFSFLTPGFTSVKNKDFQSGDSFSLSAYFSVNTFWDVAKGFRVGAEYSFGSRVNKDKEFGTANRVSFIFYYSF